MVMNSPNYVLGANHSINNWVALQCPKEVKNLRHFHNHRMRKSVDSMFIGHHRGTKSESICVNVVWVSQIVTSLQHLTQKIGALMFLIGFF